ncbi:MAG: hypothetical protein ABF629_11610 [Sporolactobacillus sp.]
MFFYIALSIVSIVIVCMLIGFIKFRRGKFDSHFVPFILNEKAIKALKANKGVSVKTLEQISNLVIAQVTFEGMLMAWYLSTLDSDMGHGLVVAIAGVRLGFGYWITHMLKKETSAAK